MHRESRVLTLARLCNNALSCEGLWGCRCPACGAFSASSPGMQSTLAGLRVTASFRPVTAVLVTCPCTLEPSNHLGSHSSSSLSRLPCSETNAGCRGSDQLSWAENRAAVLKAPPYAHSRAISAVSAVSSPGFPASCRTSEPPPPEVLRHAGRGGPDQPLRANPRAAVPKAPPPEGSPATPHSQPPAAQPRAESHPPGLLPVSQVLGVSRVGGTSIVSGGPRRQGQTLCTGFCGLVTPGASCGLLSIQRCLNRSPRQALPGSKMCVDHCCEPLYVANLKTHRQAAAAQPRAGCKPPGFLSASQVYQPWDFPCQACNLPLHDGLRGH